ncbi:hypothetical protein WJX81_003477 [Elliptochloris bilobata]|uniref:Uncharacterized protein n=1 Tax=Elliptochloris bilobata TaxID=381761 RepID=A0AAW1QBL7_9CHLO
MMTKMASMLALLALMVACTAQPFLAGQNMLPGGNIRTVDTGGPYDFSQLGTQVNEIKGAIHARQNYTDADIIKFLTNVECLEGLFDTWGAFGRGFTNDLERGGPKPYGARKANLSTEALPFAQEIALQEQGHALFTRAAGSQIPCPQMDFDGGWNKYMAAVYQLPSNETIKSKFGAAFDPFKNDENFFLCMLALEELGATGNKGLIGLSTSPVIAAGIAGLATSATAHSTVERMVLWQRRNNTVEPFNETVQQVFARVSAYRDRMDGPQFDDQGLINTDPRTIAVPAEWVNMIPADINGLTFARTPQMNINILTIGSPEGIGGFFPKGLNGVITKPTGYNVSGDGLADYPSTARLANQESVLAVGKLPPPITSDEPASVPGQNSLTQAVNGPREDATPYTRGLRPAPETAIVPALSGDAMAMGSTAMAPSSDMQSASMAAPSPSVSAASLG